MKSLSLFLLCTAILLSVACSKIDHQNDAAMAAASDDLESVSRSDDAVPDSVLNAAKCIVTIAFQHTGNREVSGVASCRTGSNWAAPAALTFLAPAVTRVPDALIVVVLSERAAASLRGGGLQLERPKHHAPLSSTKPLVTGYDLSADYMMYEVQNQGALRASEIAGEVRLRAPIDLTRTDEDAAKKNRAVRKYEVSLQSFLNTIVPTGIVIHHTAVINSDKLPESEKEVDSYHEQRGFEIECAGKVYHVAYHYLILQNGTLQRGRPERCEGAHARGYNSYLGISLVGDFSSRDNPDGSKGPEKPTDQQMKALEELCLSLRKKYNIPLQHIVRHSDLASTDCPGDRFPFSELLSRLQQENTSRSAENR